MAVTIRPSKTGEAWNWAIIDDTTLVKFHSQVEITSNSYFLGLDPHSEAQAVSITRRQGMSDQKTFNLSGFHQGSLNMIQSCFERALNPAPDSSHSESQERKAQALEHPLIDLTCLSSMSSGARSCDTLGKNCSRLHYHWSNDVFTVGLGAIQHF